MKQETRRKIVKLAGAYELFVGLLYVGAGLYGVATSLSTLRSFIRRPFEVEWAAGLLTLGGILPIIVIGCCFAVVGVVFLHISQTINGNHNSSSANAG